MKKEVLVDGMMCMKCVERVKNTLEAAGFSPEVEIGRVVCDFGDMTDEKIRDEIEALGFDVKEIK